MTSTVSAGMVVYLLTRRGTDTDGGAESRRPTPLRMAIERQHGAVALALLKAGADPERKGRLDRRPIHVAAAEGLGEVAAALIARGVALDITDRLGDTPMHLAASAHPDVYLQLKAAGASPDIRNRAGKTAASRLPARLAQLDEMLTFLLPPSRRAGRSCPRYVKIKMSNYRRNRGMLVDKASESAKEILTALPVQIDPRFAGRSGRARSRLPHRATSAPASSSSISTRLDPSASRINLNGDRCD